MSYLSVAHVVSVVLVGGASLAWLALIICKRLNLGRMAPQQSPAWFVDIFKGGLTIIRRSRWLLVIPLAAAGFLPDLLESAKSLVAKA